MKLKPYQYLNLLAREVVNTYNVWLNPKDVVVEQSLEVEEHLTISSLIPRELARKVLRICGRDEDDRQLRYS